MEAYVGAVISVPIAAIDLKQVQRDLTIVDRAAMRMLAHGPKPRGGVAKSPYIEEYRVLGDRILVPRHYRLTPRVPLTFIPDRPEPVRGSGPRIDSTIRLRPNQESPFAAIADGQDGLLELAPGAGKSECALHRIATLRRGPALIVVPNTSLMQQWQERIAKRFTHVEGGVGQLGDGKHDWRGRGLVVTTIHSVTLTDRDPELEAYFTDVVIDEAHVTMTRSFRKIYWRFSGARLALTATWDREDGLERLFPLHIGKTLYRDNSTARKAKIYFYETNVSVPDTGDPYRLPQYLTHLSRSRKRNAVVADLFASAMANPGRCILALGERKMQLRALHAWLGPERAGLCIAEVSPEERVRNMARFRYNCAITRLARDGLDAVLLDTLFALHTIPKKGGLSQAIGRTLRDPQPGDGEKSPSVVMLLEDKRNPNGGRMAGKMRRALRAWGFEWEDRVAKPPTDTPENRRLADLVDQYFAGEVPGESEADDSDMDDRVNDFK